MNATRRAWLPEQELTVGKLQAAAAAVSTGSVADLLLRAVQATLTDAAQAKTAITGRALFDALDQRCNGQLAAWLGGLCQQPEVTDPHSLVGWPRHLRPQCRRGSPQPCRQSCSRSCGWRWPESCREGREPGVDAEQPPAHRPHGERAGDGALPHVRPGALGCPGRARCRRGR